MQKSLTEGKPPKKSVRKPRMSNAEATESLDKIKKLKRELRIREAKAGSLSAVAEHCFKTESGEPMIPADHHRAWLHILETTKENLLIIAPPSHAKSTYFSIVHTADYIGRHPEHSAILISNTSTQAEKFHNAIKETIENSKEYKEIFPNILPDVKRGWNNSEIFVKRDNMSKPDPTLFSTGIGGPVIGRRANLIVVDDPTSQMDAKSDTVRQYQKDWVKQTLMSRLLPGGRMIVVMTRWHEDDIAKMLMAPEFGFKTMFFPAICDKEDDELGRKIGEALWPSERPLVWLENEKKKLGRIIFSCMYQGDPAGMGGELWKTEHFRYWSPDRDRLGMTAENGTKIVGKPQNWIRFQAADLNITGETSDDFMVVITGFMDYECNLYVERVFRKQIDSVYHKQVVKGEWKAFQPPAVAFGIEAVAAQSTFVRTLIHETSIPAIPVYPDSRDKYTRALGAVVYYENGKVYHLEGADWLDLFEKELLTFPRASHDDQVDTITYLLEVAISYMTQLLQAINGDDELTYDDRVSIGTGSY